jgi:putative phage-type endonuclease
MRTAAQERQFHEERQTGIGGSDIGKICGVSQWGTAFDVYTRLTTPIDDQPPPKDASEAMIWGNILEPVVVQHFVSLMGARVKVDLPLMRSTVDKHLIAHLDGLELAPTGDTPIAVVEAKTCGAFAARKFGREGSAQIPEDYVLQCQQNMFIADQELCHVPLLVGGQRFVYYAVERDDGMITDMRKIAAELWRRVELRDPPPMDGFDNTTDLVKRLYPVDDGTTKELPPDDKHLATIEELRVARQTFDYAKANKTRLENVIKAEAMKETTRLEWVGGYITWRKARDGQKVDWPAVAAEVGIPEDVIAKHTKPTTGSRRFLTNWTE